MKKLLLLLFVLFSLLFVKAQTVQVVTLDGSRSLDSDGLIIHYQWIQVGTTPAICKISNDTFSIATVVPANGAQWTPGVYTFRLTVTDNSGAIASDDTKVTWTAPKPTVDAGVSQAITLPNATVTLKAAATASFGKIKTWAWTQVNGPVQAIFSRKDSSTVIVSGMSAAGRYDFRVTVFDNYGQSATDSVSVIVKVANIVPKADAGPDKAISLPVSGVALGGFDSPDGAKILWVKSSGPAGDRIKNPTDSFTTVEGLVRGTYVYLKQVTTLDGQRATDQVYVVVKKKCSWLQQIFGGC